jgi:hypothetical protein
MADCGADHAERHRTPRSHEASRSVGCADRSAGPKPGDGRGRRLAREQLFAETATDDVLADRELRRVARFAFLAPDIVAAILEGRQPPSLAARQLARMPELPLDWAEQRRILGFA